MSKKSSNPDTLFILDFLGKQTDLKVVLHTVSKWLEGLIPGSMVTIMFFSEKEKHLNLISGGQYFTSAYRNALTNFSVHDKFHRALVLSGFFFLKIASTFLNSSFFPKPIKRRIAI